MDRRSALKDLVMIAGGITLLPACLNRSGKASIALKNFSINENQEHLLADIAGTIIPQTDTPGAKELGAHLFVLKMLDDCYEKEVQQKFVEGLDQLENSTKERFGKSFVNCTVQQKEKILQGVENKESYRQEVFDFYNIMKERTIQGYMTSRYVLMDIQKFEIIPSVRYNGYYRIKKA